MSDEFYHLFSLTFTLNKYMNKVEYENVMSQSEYAKLKKISRARVSQMVNEKKLKRVWICGKKFIYVEKNKL